MDNKDILLLFYCLLCMYYYLLYVCALLVCSVAILKYLCASRTVPDSWYPGDMQRHARTDEFMSWQHANLRMTGSLYFRTKVCCVTSFEISRRLKLCGACWCSVLRMLLVNLALE